MGERKKPVPPVGQKPPPPPAPPRRLDGTAQAFARRYTAVVEALQQQGVDEEVARDEARIAATLIFVAPEYVDKAQPCPTCGRSW